VPDYLYSLNRFETSLNHWHFITPEYAPELGGVSDYAKQVADALRAAGDLVHVWCRTTLASTGCDSSWVHRRIRDFGPTELFSLGRELGGYPGPRRLFVQWVPHGFGWRSMNIAFCCWLLWRSRRGEQVDLMVHEPFLSFGEGSLKQDLAACVHRLMVILLLLAADRVWVSTKSWEPKMRPYMLGRKLAFRWLPVPSNIPVDRDGGVIDHLRRDRCSDGRQVIGHFSSYSSDVAAMLRRILPSLLSQDESYTVQLLGRGSEQFREEMIHAHPSFRARIHATGPLSPEQLSRHLTACDVLLQPYPDGVTTRRTTVMASLEHGLPVVTTLGRLSEESLWSRSNALVTVSSLDPEEFVQAAVALLRDQTELSRLRAAASAFYSENFGLARIVNDLRSAHA
jgi:glycosyltransferase involved in cell wall biosynthesis